VLQKCGFLSARRRTHIAERAAPFDAETANFLAHHCAFLREFVYPHLPEQVRPLFDRLTDAGGPDSLFHAPTPSSFAYRRRTWPGRTPKPPLQQDGVGEAYSGLT
jgi:hypothetical protein